MRITWVTRSFLDYRIPVYAELNRLCGDQLTVIFYRDIVPERCIGKLRENIGDRAIGLTGEMRLSGTKNAPLTSVGKRGVRIPWQPGLVKACRESHPDVLISDGFFQWTYAALLLRMFRRIPHVMCYEPTAHTERKAGLLRTCYRKMASHAIDAICCNGKLCKEYTLSLGIPERKITIGNMAADTENLSRACSAVPEEQRAELRRKYGLSGIVFLYVGRLVPLKGLAELLKAWRGDLPATLLLVGGGPEQSRLEEYCREHDLKNVVFAGEQDYDSLPGFYAAADVFIIPTLQDNWSLVVPEAMACGLPIACSIYNGCHPELVHPENGWTFDPLDPEATAAMLQNIVDHKDDLKKMGEESSKIILDHTPQKAAENIYNTCRKVAALQPA